MAVGNSETFVVMIKERRELTFNLLCIFGALVLIITLYNRDYLKDLFTPVKGGRQAGMDDAHGISAHSLKRLLDGGQDVVIVDLRGREEYAGGHIPSARNIPYDELEARALDELSPSAQIILYCDCPSGGGWSRVGRQILLEQNFDAVHILTQGIEGWKRTGLPLVN